MPPSAIGNRAPTGTTSAWLTDCVITRRVTR